MCSEKAWDVPLNSEGQSALYIQEGGGGGSFEERRHILPG